MLRWVPLAVSLAVLAGGCRRTTAPAPGTFADDVLFLRAHTPVIVMTTRDNEASQLLVAPAFQGRVMTSTASGPGGLSFGYLHRPGILAGTRQPHMTVLGGEDRFWLGPEGGQFALYFAPGSTFDNDHWQVPEPIDWGAWTTTEQREGVVSFTQPMSVTNYAGTRFDLRVDRTIRLLDRAAVSRDLGQPIPAGLSLVAYESENRVTNTGPQAWRPETGLLSIWILGQYRPAPRTTVVIPVMRGADALRGPVVNDAYFGAIPPERLRTTEGTLFFRGDGRLRGKIGVPRPRARDVAGSYDPETHALTLVQFTLPAEARDYVNSMWAQQPHPYGGDVINSYNDGPLGPGQPPLGPFYEIESSSPAAALAPGETIQHIHRTVHLLGTDADLDAVARGVLGVSLADIVASLPETVQPPK